MYYDDDGWDYSRIPEPSLDPPDEPDPLDECIQIKLDKEPFRVVGEGDGYFLNESTLFQEESVWVDLGPDDSQTVVLDDPEEQRELVYAELADYCHEADSGKTFLVSGQIEFCYSIWLTGDLTATRDKQDHYVFDVVFETIPEDDVLDEI